MAILRAWRTLASQPDRWTWRWAAQAAAAAERMTLALTEEADALAKLLQVGSCGQMLEMGDAGLRRVLRALLGMETPLWD